MKVIVNIDVRDLPRAIEFYTSALPLTHTRTLDDDVAELSGASVTVYLLRKDAGSATSQSSSEVRHYERHWTPVHLDFVVDDVDVAAKRAVAAGARQETGYIDWRGSRCITFADPFGHGFCLIQFETGTYR